MYLLCYTNKQLCLPPSLSLSLAINSLDDDVNTIIVLL